jgi:hypothetical protein
LTRPWQFISLLIDLANWNTCFSSVVFDHSQSQMIVPDKMEEAWIWGDWFVAIFNIPFCCSLAGSEILDHVLLLQWMELLPFPHACNNERAFFGWMSFTNYPWMAFLNTFCSHCQMKLLPHFHASIYIIDLLQPS